MDSDTRGPGAVRARRPRGIRRAVRGASAAVALALVVGLAACSPTTGMVADTEIRAAVPTSFTSYNAASRTGGTDGNREIVHATNSRFSEVAADGTVAADPGYGTAKVVSRDPFTVEYTVAEGVRWSDGEPVDAADLLLAWAAGSGALDTPGFDPSGYVDETTGGYTGPLPEQTVYFDAPADETLSHVTRTPEIGDGGRSITMVFDEYAPDWRLAFEVGLPAHSVVQLALDMSSPGRAKQTLVDAVQDRAPELLSPISDAWNRGFGVAEIAAHPDRAVGSGPYAIESIDPGTSITLRANRFYTGLHRPSVERVVVSTIEDPGAAVAALQAGEVDVIAPEADAEVSDALSGIAGVQVVRGSADSWERLDLQTLGARDPAMSDVAVRTAFLSTVPRDTIVRQAALPADPDATTRDSFVLAPGSDGYDDQVRANGSSRFDDVDLDEARQLLASVGRTAPEVCVLYDPADPRRVAAFEAIRDSAEKAGFVVTDCSTPQWESVLDQPGAYDVALLSSQDAYPSVAGIRAAHEARADARDGQATADPDVASLFASLSRTEDQDARDELLLRLDRRMYGDRAGLPLYQLPALAAARDGIGGVQVSPHQAGILDDAWRWTLSRDAP
ncbi:ABC transporter family substrate-binding protein [Clavibacter michiganensis]|uniref:ABC transporter family substrate-binding protein n=2 Tax=Clavibacter michiganensis TaxID=28447 RepID=UPI00292F2AD7|nr:ABC transporter family substrate-binding protein [Clavibacter michiganensis]